MGREIRKVPPNWNHPKDNEGQYIPLFNETYAEACITTKENNEEECLAEEKAYRPFKDEEATWFQAYENVSEGTPVTPPFETKEELIQYLINHGTFWSDGKTYTREQAEAFIKNGWAPSAVGFQTSEGMHLVPGIEAATLMKKEK